VIAGAPVRKFADERGQSLVLTLLVLFVLAIVLSTVIIFTSSNQRTSNYQKASQVASSLAEAGVNNAVSVLANPFNSCCLMDSWAADGNSVLPDNSAQHPAQSSNYNGNTVKWWGTVDSSGLWKLSGQATVKNPTGPSASSITKTVTATVQVHQPNPGTIDVGVWNSIYSPYGPTSGCDTTVAQGVLMTVPLYVGGNLCVNNSATINAPVYVGGFLSFANKQAAIGCAQSSGSGCVKSAPVNSAHVGSYCQVQTTTVNPCKSEPTTPDTNIWVKNPSSWNPAGLPSDFVDPVTGQLITAPQICWGPGTCTGDLSGGWYSMASPGPLHPCNAVSGTPPVFDNNTTWGPQETPAQTSGSVPGTFNLTPDGQSYSCTTKSGGQLSWNYVTRTLTVNGTIFIDGNVYATSSSNTPVTYTGSGTCTDSTPCDGVIYVTGTVLIKSVKICALVSGTDCDWANWDPNAKILAFLAYSQGSQTGVGAGQGIVVTTTNTSFQGALYANYQVFTGQGAATQGPLVSGTQTVVTGQQFQGSFPPITILPMSMQGPPKAFYIDPPTFNFSG
jgi:Tfp pilus assembly protein PilX